MIEDTSVIVKNPDTGGERRRAAVFVTNFSDMKELVTRYPKQIKSKCMDDCVIPDCEEFRFLPGSSSVKKIPRDRFPVVFTFDTFNLMSEIYYGDNLPEFEHPTPDFADRNIRNRIRDFLDLSATSSIPVFQRYPIKGKMVTATWEKKRWISSRTWVFSRSFRGCGDGGCNDIAVCSTKTRWIPVAKDETGVLEIVQLNSAPEKGVEYAIVYQPDYVQKSVGRGEFIRWSDTSSFRKRDGQFFQKIPQREDGRCLPGMIHRKIQEGFVFTGNEDFPDFPDEIRNLYNLFIMKNERTSKQDYKYYYVFANK